MAERYLTVLHAGFDDKVQKAIREISAKPKVTLDDFMRGFGEITKAPGLVFIMDKSDVRITPQGRTDFLFSEPGRNSVSYPLNNDNTINFKEPVYGNDVDPRYL